MMEPQSEIKESEQQPKFNTVLLFTRNTSNGKLVEEQREEPLNGRSVFDIAKSASSTVVAFMLGEKTTSFVTIDGKSEQVDQYTAESPKYFIDATVVDQSAFQSDPRANEIYSQGGRIVRDRLGTLHVSNGAPTTISSKV